MHTRLSASRHMTILSSAGPPCAPSESPYVYAHRRPRCDSRCQERGDVPSRVPRLWCGTARHPARAQHVPTSTAAPRRATPALYLPCTQTTASIAESCITSARVPSKHIQVAPHGHHAVIESRARRGARDSRRIQLIPLHRGRREPNELIRHTCTIQHAHSPVSLKTHDDTILCRAPLCTI
jgi:hypothetical protein